MDTQPDTRPIWPGRIEVIYQAYCTEKEAWLASHLTIRPSDYRKSRGLHGWTKRQCRAQIKFLPFQRLDLSTETLSEEDPDWTIPELEAWLDYDKRQDQVAEEQCEQELIQAGGYSRIRDSGMRGIMGSVRDSIQAQEREYRFRF